MIGVLTQQSGPVRKGTSGASFAQVRRGISGVRRGQSRVAGWTGTSDAIGRADGAGPACLGEGADRRTQDQVRVGLLPGADQRVFVDIDSLLRPVYGHAKQGASYGHTKIAGKQILRKGLSPLATTISTTGAAPVIAGMRLRAGRANSGKGAGRM